MYSLSHFPLAQSLVRNFPASLHPLPMLLRIILILCQRKHRLSHYPETRGTLSASWLSWHQQFRKRARPPPPSAAIPSVWPRVPLTAALLRATPRYLAPSPTITTTEDLSPFWLGSFVKQGAAAINQRTERSDSWATAFPWFPQQRELRDSLR